MDHQSRADEYMRGVERQPHVSTAAPPLNYERVRRLLTERGERYGDFANLAGISQALKSFLQAHASGSLAPDQREALEMIAGKIARILNGDPNYADSWLDIAGYAKLVADRLEGGE